MSTDITDEAWSAADAATDGLENRSDILARGVTAAAPLIVAAYLDRLADDAHEEAQCYVSGSPVSKARRADYETNARSLRRRAAELRAQSTPA